MKRRRFLQCVAGGMLAPLAARAATASEPHVYFDFRRKEFSHPDFERYGHIATDATTGKPICGVFAYDSKTKICRRFATDANGLFYPDPEERGPAIIEEIRPLKFVRCN